jgi:hypothetical protein
MVFTQVQSHLITSVNLLVQCGQLHLIGGADRPYLKERFHKLAIPYPAYRSTHPATMIKGYEARDSSAY